MQSCETKIYHGDPRKLYKIPTVRDNGRAPILNALEEDLEGMKFVSERLRRGSSSIVYKSDKGVGKNAKK